jgi:hypothetical protein
MNQLRLFKRKHYLLKISVDLQTALAADTLLAEGQWLKGLRMFRVGTRMLFPGQKGNSIQFISLFIYVLTQQP